MGRFWLVGRPEPGAHFDRYRLAFRLAAHSPSLSSRWLTQAGGNITSGWKIARLAYNVLHLVAAEVLIGKPIEPRAELLAGVALGECARYFGVFEDGFIHEDGAVHTQRQSQRVAWPRVDRHHLPFALDPDQRVKRIVLEIIHHDFLHAHFRS